MFSKHLGVDLIFSPRVLLPRKVPIDVAGEPAFAEVGHARFHIPGPPSDSPSCLPNVADVLKAI